MKNLKKVHFTYKRMTDLQNLLGLQHISEIVCFYAQQRSSCLFVVISLWLVNDESNLARRINLLNSQ